MFYKFKIIFFILTFSLIGSAGFAADIYVDPTLSQNITDGKYSIENRNNSGSDGNAYTTVQAALNAMNGGDDIYLRGGTYQRAQLTEGSFNTIEIPDAKDGTPENWSSIQSYSGEWAILDGENNCEPSPGCVLRSGDSGWKATKYWKIERLEIKNGSSPDRTWASGMSLGYGPFQIRYCYIHNNLANTGANNPSGIRSGNWEDSIVEYCYFNDNGGDTSHNSCHLQPFGNYAHDQIADIGYNDEAACRRNEYRYNLFEGGTVGIKHKGNQLFTSRRTFSDTYKTYGDKIHHNIFLDLYEVAIRAKQDFVQVYNNIAINCGGGVKIGHERRIYKAVVYNNSIISCNDKGNETLPFERVTKEDTAYAPWENPNYFGYDYNNIIEDGGSTWSGGEMAIGYSINQQLPNLTNYFNRCNYFYNGRDSNLISITGNGSRDYYTAQSYNDSFPQNLVYSNLYQASDPLYIATSGSDRFKTSGSHIISAGITIANGGVGGSHPYLQGISLPTYIGAVDPQNNGWVNEVLSLADMSTLMNTGAGETQPQPLAPPANLSIAVVGP